MAQAQQFRDTIDRYSDKDRLQAQLRSRVEAKRQELERAAAALSQARHEAADRLRKRVEAELKKLALPGARFGVQFTSTPAIGARGSENAQFVFAANKGEPERPLARVASGGELSRVLLALVVVLAGLRATSTLVFDEIDSGVGGATANAVGARLGRLARHGQVVCVTHLAQIASWADAHYALEKRETRDAAAIEVRAIENQRDRAAEVARMLSGEAHEAALRHARALLKQTQERRLAAS